MDEQKPILIKSEKDLPEAPISQGTSLINKTGSWRNVRPVLVERSAPCQNACPLKVYIQSFIDLLTRGEKEKAAIEILKNNPFPLLTGKFCPAKCEIGCNRKKYDEPVAIKALETFLGKIAYEKSLFAPRMSILNKKAAVIGGTETAMSCAYFLNLWGVDVTVYASDIFNGLGLSNADIEKEKKRLTEFGVRFSDGHMEAEAALSEYDAVFTDRGAEILDNKLKNTKIKGLFAAFPEKKDFARDLYAGKRAAKSMLEFMMGEEIRPDERLPRVVSFNDIVTDYFEPENRIEYIETLEDAVKEGNRCFSCGHCNSCGNCYVFCPDNAITWVNDYPVVNYDYCKGCGVCVNECPRSALEMIPER